MAVTTTARLGLTRWSAGTDPFTRAQMDASMAALEANAAMYSQGTLAARPAFGKAGRLYSATDQAAPAANLFYDTGTAWLEARPDLSSYATSATVTSGLAGKANTAHVHAAADTTSGIFAVARLGSGAPSASTYLRGDGAWTVPPVASMATLSDATITTPATGHFLRYDAVAGKWVNILPTSADISGLDAALAGKAALSHTHTKANITDFAHTHLIADLPVAASGVSNTTSLVRADDTRLADARTPVAHVHAAADTTSGIFAIGRIPTAADGAATVGTVPLATDLRLSNPRTPTAHSHPTSDVTGLDTALANKSAVGHTHTKANITDFAHTHLIADLPVALSGVSNTTSVVRADDARLADARTPLTHSHPTSQITGLDTALAAKQDTTDADAKYAWATQGGREKLVTLASGATMDLSLGSVFYMNPSAYFNMALTNVPGAGFAATVTLILNTAEFQVGLPTGGLWFGPTPVWNTKQTIITLITRDGGTTWIVSGAQQQ